VHPPALSEPMNVITIANNTGPTVFAQYGALAALSPEGGAFLKTMRERCRAGREVVQQSLDKQNRIRWIKPEGAFYGFLHVEGLSNSLDFALALVRDGRVGVAPGSAFGPEPANDSYVRICFAQDPARLKRGLERLGAAVSAL
jgi:aspartate aminotransferase